MDSGRSGLFPAVFVTCLLLLTPAHAADPSKILYVDSYHAGYPWSDGIRAGIEARLEGANVDLAVTHLDTKRRKTEAHTKAAVARVLEFIRREKPDLIIASDDNASRYLVEPHLKDSNIPIVFCGVNLDASVYGYPYKNATGMVEVSLYKPMIPALEALANGKRMAILSSSAATAYKEARVLREKYGMEFSIRHPATFSEWKKNYMELQKRADFLIIWSNSGIESWDDTAARRFVKKNSSVPSGATLEFMAEFALITYAKIPQEQGEWAALTALKILRGASPDSIPLTTNREGRLVINSNIAASLNLELPVELIELADRIIE